MQLMFRPRPTRRGNKLLGRANRNLLSLVLHSVEDRIKSKPSGYGDQWLSLLKTPKSQEDIEFSAPQS
jgi:hypothetical protein